ncbi:hypothetical protein [uncultured Shewanella sp.]|uniref:hypothetical protein n=1 Tax=uncultured Shewanella sp. TaxID=173975 RepID=UPI00262F327C|nr:hypothetical protein [uncultured Shewanella sp.]
MSIRLLNKMTPRSVALDIVRGGVPEISSSDVAAALSFGNLSEAACNFGLAKYCSDNIATYKLMDYFNEIIKEKVKIERWSQGINETEGLARLMMLEGVYGVRCNKCKGRGHIIQAQKGRGVANECGKCHGSGLGTFSQRRRAEIANISSSSWDRHWKLRLDKLLVYAYELESQLNRHLKMQFFN